MYCIYDGRYRLPRLLDALHYVHPTHAVLHCAPTPTHLHASVHGLLGELHHAGLLVAGHHNLSEGQVSSWACNNMQVCLLLLTAGGTTMHIAAPKRCNMLGSHA